MWSTSKEKYDGTSCGTKRDVLQWKSQKNKGEYNEQKKTFYKWVSYSDIEPGDGAEC